MQPLHIFLPFVVAVVRLCRFPQAGYPRQEYGFAVLTNRRRIHEKEYQKTPNAKLHSVFFGTPDGNRTHN